MKKSLVLMIAVFLLLLAACDRRPDETVNNSPPGDFGSAGSVEVRDKQPGEIDARERLLALGYPEAELDAIIESGISLESILNQGLTGKYADRINANLPIGPSGEVILREYYGGIYFNDNGVLTVMVLDEAFDHAASVIAIAEMRELGLAVISAEFTDRDLNEAINTLNNMVESVVDAGATSWSLDTKGNRVVVRLDPYTDEQKAVFLNLLLDASIAPAMISIVQAVTQEMLDQRAAAIEAATQSPGNQIVLFGEVAASRTGIVFSLENRANTAFNYGEHWDMACYSDGRWMPVPHLPGAGNLAWHDLGYSLQGGGIQRYRQEWIRFFGELPPGRYMYIRAGWLGEWQASRESVYALVEFFITGDSPAELPPQPD